LAAEIQFGLAMAVGQESVVADTLKAGWQSVLQEAANEVLSGNRHDFVRLLAVTVVFPLKANLTGLHLQQAAIGDGHAMSVAA